MLRVVVGERHRVHGVDQPRYDASGTSGTGGDPTD